MRSAPPPFDPPRFRRRDDGTLPPDYWLYFDAWANETVRWFNAAHPNHRPFCYPAHFDGASRVPDIARHCALTHDLRYWFQDHRADADSEFRICIVACGEREEPMWRWYWYGLGWIRWAGVRMFGGRAWRT